MTSRSHLLRPAGRRAPVIALVTLALLATSLWATRWPVPDVVSLSPTRAAAQTAPAAPSGGFAFHGGLGGQIDERTGQFSITAPLVTVNGQGTADVSVQLNWQQERAATTPDRSGWGAGWSIGSSFVDVTGLQRVYPASGGSFLLDPSEPSGLKHYKLQDLKFTSTAGILPRRPGAGQVSYSYELAYDDGRADYFDSNGNLAARIDRLGNRTDITWQGRANNVWRPTSIIDSYGLTTTFDYSTPGQVKLVSPERSDGVVPTMTIAVSATQGVQSLTDPVGNKTTFSYTSVSGAPKPLITLITAATGARTAVSYQSPQNAPIAVASLKVTDATGNAISPVQTFSLNPSGNNGHNYTGYPNHLPTAQEPDALFASGDAVYTYTTSLTTGTTTTLSTYDALHRLIRKQISIPPKAGQAAVPAQTHEMTYPTPVRVPALLPANYAHPAQVSLTESAATSLDGLTASPPRTTTTSTTYDDHGRVLSATDEIGTTTTTEYDDRFGLVTTQTTTGADGSQAQLVNTLTPDGTNYAGSTTSVGKAGETLSARQTLSYEYDDDGQLIKRTLAWAPGADPDADAGGGPDEIVTTFDRALDLNDATQSITTTIAAGTSAAQPTTTTVDLVSLKPVSSTDAMGRTTTIEYDAIGRQTKSTTPGGMVTTTAYTPTQTTVTTPDGRVTRSTADLLGRTVSVTDNVRNGAFVADPAARTVSAVSYSRDGTSATATDQAGRTTATVLDAFGRTVSQDGPTGLTHLKSYDDGAAHTTVAALVPDGAAQPLMSTTTSYDDASRVIQSQTSYVAGGGTIADPVSANAFDGLGQPITSTQNDLTVTTDRSGPGGIAASSTAAPQSTDEFPGEPMSAITTRALAGQATSRTLHQGDEVSTAVSVAYDAAGNMVSATDPEGRTTTYAYTPDGQPLTKTGPSGTVTSHTYDPASGLLSGMTVTAPGQPTRTITFTRVPAGRPGAGQVATVSDGAATITYGYDVDGNRTSVGYPDGTSTSADFNDKGQLVSTTDVTGAVTSYVYDAADGTVTSATQRRGGTVLASVAYTYDALSRVATTTRANGTVTTNTYTDQNQLATQTTTNAAGQVLEAHSYTYDAHYNPATRTDTYPRGGNATPTGGTWTTVYSYDSYDRLIGSAVYSGPLTNGQPTGLSVTTTGYKVDLGGDVVSTTKTTRPGGIRPTITTTTSTNTIDDSGRLIAQRTGSTTATQTFDEEGRVLRSLNGVTTTYMTDGSPASTTLPDGTTTTYTLWPDGTRRSATTTSAGGDTSAVTYHYGVDGVLLNDSTNDTSTPAGTATTASYLVTAAREARTLLAGTATTGKVTATPGPPIDTGTGVGYYLRDRHTSVTGLVDDTGTVTATYAYSDYGTSARADGRPVNLGTYDGGRTNPYTYLGASPRGPATETGSGLLAFDDRTYDPRQGRFTSSDPVDAHNRYQAFNTNPITNLDLSGQISVTDIVLDVVFAVVMIASVVVTGGAATAAVGAIAAVEAGTEVATSVVVSAVANTVATGANIVGAATNTLLAINDGVALKSPDGEGFLGAQGREGVNTANTIVAAIAGVSGAAAGLAEHATAAAAKAAAAATKQAASNANALADAAKGLDTGWQLDATEVTFDVPAEVQVDVPAQVQVEAQAAPQPAARPNVTTRLGPRQDPRAVNVEIIHGNPGPQPLDLQVEADAVPDPVPDPRPQVGNQDVPSAPKEVLPDGNGGGGAIPDQVALKTDPPLKTVTEVAKRAGLGMLSTDPTPIRSVDWLDLAAPTFPTHDPGTLLGSASGFTNQNVLLLAGGG